MITVTVVDESVQVSVPGWVKDVGSFRRWADADDFPEGGVIYWLVDARKDPPQFDVLRHTARG